MRRLSALALASTLATTACGASSAAVPQDAGVESIDPRVSSIVTGGEWESGGDVGTYRMVVRQRGWEHTRGELHLQWLEEDHDNYTVTLARSVPVRELNEADVWALGGGSFETPEDGPTVLVLPATHTYSMVDSTFRITFGPPGQYRVTPTP